MPTTTRLSNPTERTMTHPLSAMALTDAIAHDPDYIDADTILVGTLFPAARQGSMLRANLQTAAQHLLSYRVTGDFEQVALIRQSLIEALAHTDNIRTLRLVVEVIEHVARLGALHHHRPSFTA